MFRNTQLMDDDPWEDLQILREREEEMREEDVKREKIVAEELAKEFDRSDQQETSKPYMPFHLSELCALKTVDHWTNRKVRVLGSIFELMGYDCHLSSVCEEGGPYYIRMKMDLLDQFPPKRSIIQVFGEIEVPKNDLPVIQARFFRRMDEVDANHYNKSVKIIQKYVPPYVKQVNESGSSQN